jgi:hypothetical protein
MRRRAGMLLRNCWFGLAYCAAALIGSLIYTWIAGPLFGRINAAGVAFMLLVFGVLVVAGIVAIFRQPNPYSRIYYRYELMDVPDQLRGKLDSGGNGWLWQVAPMMVVGIILLPFFA